jgi:hypothetical protein
MVVVPEPLPLWVWPLWWLGCEPDDSLPDAPPPEDAPAPWLEGAICAGGGAEDCAGVVWTVDVTDDEAGALAELADGWCVAGLRRWGRGAGGSFNDTS